MTKLEKHIYKLAKPEIERINKEFQNREFKGGTVIVPIMIDGVIDQLVYDVNERRVIEIRYLLGKGHGVVFELLNESMTAYFDETTQKTIKV